MASIYDQTQPPPGYIWDGHGHLIPNPNPYTPPPVPWAQPNGLAPPAGQGSGEPTGSPWTPPNGAIPIGGQIGVGPGNSTTPPGFTADYTHGYYIPIAGYQTPGPTPTPTPTPGPGGGGGGPAPGSAPTPFAWPEFHAPGFVPATSPTAPPPFTHPDFTAPTLDEAKNQPGYAFGLQQGLGAYENSAAARGILRGGGTLKGLFDYGNAAAEQNYANVYSQNANTYNTNLAKDAGTYATNWNVTKDVSSLGNAANQQNYGDAFQNAGAEFNPKFQAAQLSFQDMWNRWNATNLLLQHLVDQGGA